MMWIGGILKRKYKNMAQQTPEWLKNALEDLFQNIEKSKSLKNDLPEIKSQFTDSIKQEMVRLRTKADLITEVLQKLLNTESTVNLQAKIEKLVTLLEAPLDCKTAHDVIAKL